MTSICSNFREHHIKHSQNIATKSHFTHLSQHVSEVAPLAPRHPPGVNFHGKPLPKPEICPLIRAIQRRVECRRLRPLNGKLNLINLKWALARHTHCPSPRGGSHWTPRSKSRATKWLCFFVGRSQMCPQSMCFERCEFEISTPK